MKRHLLTCIALTCAVLGAMAQRNYNFNAVAFNVDGLPNKDIDAVVTTVNLNKDGKNEEGATTICNTMAYSNWDIVGISEDFNFHSQLTADPAIKYYDFGKHSGSINTEISSAFDKAEVDGLGIAVTRRFTFTGDSDNGLQVAWEKEYGGSNDFTGDNGPGENGADQLITKGFRMYTVTIATGIVVDVYVLHMDAGTADEDDESDLENGKDRNVIAREAQLTQLATYIKEYHNNRPVIILGDFNCRYTREQLKTGFIDVINADSRLTINDPWVDLMWGGVYPEYGTGSIMTHTYGMQKGEIVDKVFYINTTESDLTLKANSYLHDESVNVSEHKPVVVNFTLTDPSGTPLTDAEKEESWTLEETEATFQKPSWKGEKVVSGTTYYVMNVGTGRYVKWGGQWTAQAVTGYAGHPMTPTLSDGKYELVTIASEGRSLGHNLFMDNTEKKTWTLTPVNGTTNHYYLENSDGVLTASSSDNALSIKAKNENDDTQKWIFLTESGMLTAMTDANPDYPFNFTPMLGAADFDWVDGWNGYANEHWTNYENKGLLNWWQNPGEPKDYNYSGMTVSTAEAVTISQTIKDIPAGNYKFSFEGFYNYILTTTTITEKRTRKSPFNSWGSYSESGRTSSSSEQTMSCVVTLGSETFTLSPDRSVNVGDAGRASEVFRDGDEHMHSSFQTLAVGDLNISIAKPATSTNPSNSESTETNFTSTEETKTTTKNEYSNSVHFDNFRLEYRGTQTVAIDPYADYKKLVRDKVNATYPLVQKLNAAGQAAYDISIVVDRYNNDQITSGDIAQAMVDYVDAAYANALAAHKAFYVEEALKNMEANGGDVTGAIINPSFETGDTEGWTVGNGWDVGVKANSDGTYTTSGCDGNNLFNAYSGDDDHTTTIKQTITGLKPGLYELKASLTSFSTNEMTSHNEHYRVYLTGNSYHTYIVADEGKTVFKEATLYFLVEDGSATIGAVGGNKGGGTEFIHYWPFEGCFFKADNFRLKYICDIPHGRLKLALDEANAAVLDAYGKEALDLSSYETMYANKSLTTNGKSEAAAVYTALQKAAKAQRTAGADMTWAIENPSFETGDYTGWTTTKGSDTGVKAQEIYPYHIAGTDGRYLFNTWNDGENDENSGVNAAVTQTVTDIPNGTYKVTAMVASDTGNSINLTANGTTATIAASTNGKTSGVFPTVDCTVTDGTLAISVVGVDNVWYKCDDFHLTLVKPSELVFDETDKVIPEINNVVYPKVVLNRTIKSNTWSTFVVPFDIPEGMLGGWEVKELTSSSCSDDRITLVFSDAAGGIKAGVPYMVRNKTSGLDQITMTDVTVNTTVLKNKAVDDVTFIGVYTAGNVPQNSYFISGNVFYKAKDTSNRLKGFRAHLMPKDPAKARSLGYRFADNNYEEGTTGIDTPDEEPTVVAIYTAGGVRIDDMQQGVNILLMSDGTTVKVIIK